MFRRTITLNLPATLLFLVMFVFCPGDGVAADNTSRVPQPVPGKLDLRSLTGEQFSLIPFLGKKTVVLVFWATWCPICRTEVPRLNRLNSNPSVKVIAINGGESIKKIQAFIASYKVGYEVVHDPGGTAAKSFGVPGIPCSIIIGRSGLIVYRGSGLPEDADHFLTQ